MPLIKCVYIEVLNDDFWPEILTELVTDPKVHGIYDATNSTLMPKISTLEEAEIFMEGK